MIRNEMTVHTNEKNILAEGADAGPTDHRIGPCPGPLLVVCIIVPEGVVTVI